MVITTHYIDEAKQSDLVGFLHEGRMLAEESPDVLMRLLSCKTLEQVFLKLCYQNMNKSDANEDHRNDLKNLDSNLTTMIVDTDLLYRYSASNNYKLKCDGQKQLSNSNNNNGTYPNQYPMDHNDDLFDSNKTLNVGKTFHSPITSPSSLMIDDDRSDCHNRFLHWDHIKALTSREWFFFRHNLWLFAFYILLPLLTVFLFDSSYGRTPQNVPIAIYNGDQSEISPQLSDVFIDEFNNSMVRLNSYETEQDAVRSVELGRNVIAISFRKNFSTAIIERYYKFHQFKPTDIIDHGDGSMFLYIDHSSLLNVRYVNRSILLSFQRMVEKLGKLRGLNPMIFSLPIEKKEYVYGVLEPHFQDLFLPGIIVLTLLAMNSVKSTFEIIYLYSNGCLKRDINQGVRPIEMMLTFVFGSMASMFWQTLITMFFTFYIIGVPMDGDFFSAVILVYLTASQGLFMGILLSVIFPDQVIAMVIFAIFKFVSKTLNVFNFSTILDSLFHNPCGDVFNIRHTLASGRDANAYATLVYVESNRSTSPIVSFHNAKRLVRYAIIRSRRISYQHRNLFRSVYFGIDSIPYLQYQTQLEQSINIMKHFR